jgi:hypothetical protein
LKIYRTHNNIEVFVLKLNTLKVLSVLEQNVSVLSISFGGISKGDIFPVNNNAIDDNNFPRYRSTYCDFSICSPYNAVIFWNRSWSLLVSFVILSAPVSVNESLPHATQLFDVNDYFIISSNQQFYTTLAQSAINQCQGRNLMTCTLHPMLRTSAEITCLAALFLNDKEKIKAKCNFRFLLNKIKPRILELPLSKILIFQSSHLQICLPSYVHKFWKKEF